MNVNRYLLTVGILAATALGVLSCLPKANAGVDSVMQNQTIDPAVQIGDYCSGTIVKSARDQASGEVETVILTAKHCVSDTKVVDVVRVNHKNMREIGKTVYRGDVSTCWSSDIATVTLRDKDTWFPATARIAKDEPSYGDEVVSVAFPKGRSLTITEGRLGYIEEVPFFATKSNEFYRATPDIIGGSSGAPLFVKSETGYEVVGVTTGGYRDNTFMNYFTPLNEIKTCLKDKIDASKRGPQ